MISIATDQLLTCYVWYSLCTFEPLICMAHTRCILINEKRMSTFSCSIWTSYLIQSNWIWQSMKHLLLRTASPGNIHFTFIEISSPDHWTSMQTLYTWYRSHRTDIPSIFNNLTLEQRKILYWIQNAYTAV